MLRDRLHECRFIPAYAGNSAKAINAIHFQTVHPRLRGELFCTCSSSMRWRGSSPLTRGTRESFLTMLWPAPVHPRLRGELKFARSLDRLQERFIPAYAGNSLKDGINPSIHTLGI